MAVRRDQVNLTVTVNGNDGKKQLADLDKQAVTLRASMRGLKKDTEAYASAEKELKRVESQMDKIRRSMDLSTLSMRELRAEGRRIPPIRDQLNPLTKDYKTLDDRLRQVNGRMKELRTGGQSVNPVLAGIKQALPPIGAAAAVAFATDKVIGFVSNTFQLGKNLQGIEQGFERLNQPQLLDNLRTATRGTVNDLELMQLAVQADNFSIPLDLLAKGLEFAQKRASATGESVDHLTQSFVTGLGRKSPQILDNLGISMVDLRKEIERTGDFNTAVTSIVNSELGEMGDVALGTGGKLAIMQTDLENLQAELARGLNATLEDTIDFLGAVATDAAGPVREDLLLLRDDLIRLRDEFKELLVSTGLVGQDFDFIQAASGLVQLAIGNMVDRWRALTFIITTSIERVTGFVDGVKTASNAVTDFLGITSKQNRESRQLQREREANARTNERLAAEASEQLKKTLVGDVAAATDAAKKIEKETGKRSKKTRELVDGSIEALRAQVTKLTQSLQQVKPEGEAYLQLVFNLIDATEKLAIAEAQRAEAFFQANVQLYDLQPVLDYRDGVQTINAGILKNESDLSADLKKHQAKRNKDLEKAVKKYNKEYQDLFVSLDEGVGFLMDGFGAVGSGISTILGNVSDDAQEFAGLQKALALFDILLNQGKAIASAIAGATAAAAATGPGAPFALGGYIASMMAAVLSGIGQAIGVVKKQTVPQRFFGGYHQVIGATDGKTHTAQYRPDQVGGDVASPSLVLGGENGPEYWVPNWMMRIPEIFDITRSLEAIRVGRQFAQGGFDRGAVAESSAANPPAAPPPAAPETVALQRTLQQLIGILDRGIFAKYDDPEIRKIRQRIGTMQNAERRAIL